MSKEIEKTPEGTGVLQNFGRYNLARTLLAQDGFLRVPEGEYKGKIDFDAFINLPKAEAINLLRERTKHLIQGLLVLDKDGKFGVFNRHDFTHIDFVQKWSHILLKASDSTTPDTEYNIATAISYLHDLGNIFSRHLHSDPSTYFFDDIFTNYELDDERVQTVFAGIWYHDESIGSYIYDFADLRKGNGEEYKYKRAIWSPIVADKIHIGQDRLSTRFTESNQEDFDPRELLDKDPHVALSLYVQDMNLEITSDYFNVDINFSSDGGTDLDPSLRRLLEKFWKDGRAELYVPGVFYAQSKNGVTNGDGDHLYPHLHTPYVKTFSLLMQTLYSERFSMAASCLFALFPRLREFRINTYDCDPLIHSGDTNVFKRGSWQARQFFIWKLKNHVDSKDLAEGRVDTPPIIRKGYDIYLREKAMQQKKCIVNDLK